MPHSTLIFRTMFDPNGLAWGMPLAVVACDIDWRITGWNPAAEKLFGWNIAEALNKDVLTLLAPNIARSQVIDRLSALDADGGPAISIDENVNKDGQIVICEWHNTVLRDAEGKALGFVGIARDLTPERQAKLARERLQAIAAAANSAWDLDE